MTLDTKWESAVDPVMGGLLTADDLIHPGGLSAAYTQSMFHARNDTWPVTNSLIRGVSVPSDMRKAKMSPCEDAVKITAGGKDVLRNNHYQPFFCPFSTVLLIKNTHKGLFTFPAADNDCVHGSPTA